jgi:hypothetical protein
VLSSQRRKSEHPQSLHETHHAVSASLCSSPQKSSTALIYTTLLIKKVSTGFAVVRD